MKKLIGIVLAMLMLFACACAAPAQSTDAPASAQQPAEATQAPAAEPGTEPAAPKTPAVAPKVALVISNTIENAVDAAVYQGLNALSASYPFEFAFTEKATSDTVENILRTYIEQGFNVIVCNAGIGRDATHLLAREYEDVYFIQMGSDLQDPNFNEAYYELTAPQSSFLLGVVAGLASENGSVGYIGAMPLSNINVKGNSFFDGAQYVKPDMKFSGAYMESYYDPVKCKELANSMIAGGADVIFSDRAGMVEACQEGGAFACWSGEDKVAEAPDVCIATVLMNMDVVFKRALDSWSEGAMLSGYELFSYETNMERGDFTMVVNEALLSAELLAQYQEIYAKVESGEIQVTANAANVADRNS